MKEPTVPGAEQFRNQATGIGQCRDASERTGACRAREIVETTDTKATPEQMKAAGFPPKSDDMLICERGPGYIYQTSLRHSQR